MKRAGATQRIIHVAAAALAIGSCANAMGGSAPAARPNIVLILADDVGCEPLGCYGGTSYRTPRLDDLCRGGMHFQHAYSMPVCHPTRVCMLTGCYPFRLGNPRWGTFPQTAERQTVARVLKEAGYATAVAGKWQLALLGKDLQQPNRLGFDEYCLFGWHEGPRYYDPLIWQNGRRRDDTAGRYGPDVYVEFLVDFMQRHRDEPFFAFYSMALCHDVTDDLDAPVPYGPRGRYDNYKEMIEAMDERIGRVVAALDRLGLRKKTLILFTGDNGTAKESIIRAEGKRMIREPVVSMLGGTAVPGGKGNLTNDGTRVPLIANWPGTVAAEAVADDLIDFSDFLPTFAELAGAAPPADVQRDGHSFTPLLRGTGRSRRRWAFAEHKGAHWVRTRRWKLYNDGRLFDLESDPGERDNLATDEQGAAAADARAQLQQALDAL